MKAALEMRLKLGRVESVFHVGYPRCLNRDASRCVPHLYIQRT
jgi:hypothetical protein